MSRVKRWGPLRSLLVLSPVLFGAPFVAYMHHTSLPVPNTNLTDSETGLPLISEQSILNFAKHLSEDIGYRTVGTAEHAQADKWMVDRAFEIQTMCQRLVKESKGERKLECEVWRQEGNGYHRFDIMKATVYKTYVGLSNIIIRISDGTAQGKENALLVNSHLDSTLPSPGAADDALSVGVMLDCIRVLLGTPGWSPSHAIVFLFNNAEESLQDGSHLYSTQHETAKSVRAVVNLEAAGTRGKEILFQATSEQMIDAYARVPRPFGTILASDIFAMNLIQSDTDFGQFQKYLNITGLDMAVVGNGYYYHMKKDLVENIQPGVAQNMAENALALITYLSSPASPLPSLTGGYVRPQTVYFTFFSTFIVFSFTMAKLLYATLCFGSLALVQVVLNPKSGRRLGDLARGIFANILAFISAFVVPNVVALVMSTIIGRPMSWFSREWLPIILFSPPALLGVFVSQLFIMAYLKPLSETTLFSSILLIQSFLALGIQLAGVGSAVLMFLTATSLFSAFSLNPVFLAAAAPSRQPTKLDPATSEAMRRERKQQMNAYAKVSTAERLKELDVDHGEVSLWTYAIGQIIPLLMGTLVAVPILEVFVPMMGRVGPAPSDNVVATIVAFVSTVSVPLAVPFSHRFGKDGLKRMALLLTLVIAVELAVFARKEPYDDSHQKRMFIFRVENVTSHEHHLHLAQCDSSPAFPSLVREIADQFAVGHQELQVVPRDDHKTSWGSLYPFSLVLDPYKVPLRIEPGYISPYKKFQLTLMKDIRDAKTGTRALTLKVLEWDLGDNPPNENTRHLIKEASFYGKNSYEISMTIKDSGNGLGIDFSGIQENGMWPGKKRNLAATSKRQPGGLALALFAEMDAWLNTNRRDWADVFHGIETGDAGDEEAGEESAEPSEDESKTRAKEARMKTNKRKATNFYSDANVKNKNRKKAALLKSLPVGKRGGDGRKRRK